MTKTIEKVSVRLIARAKVEGKWRKPGEDVAVDQHVAAQLEEAGAIAMPEVSFRELAPGMPGFDEEVGKVAKVIADAAIAAAVEAATAELSADRDAARIRAEEAEAHARSNQARNLELEAEIADLHDQLKAQAAATENGDAPAGDTTSAPPAAKTAPKKGAAAKG